MLIVLLLAYLYGRFSELAVVKSVLGQLRPAVVAMIASAGMAILILALTQGSTGSWIPVHPVELILFVVCLFLLRKKKCGPIQIVFLSAVLGTAAYLLI